MPGPVCTCVCMLCLHMAMPAPHSCITALCRCVWLRLERVLRTPTGARVEGGTLCCLAVLRQTAVRPHTAHTDRPACPPPTHRRAFGRETRSLKACYELMKAGYTNGG